MNPEQVENRIKTWRGYCTNCQSVTDLKKLSATEIFELADRTLDAYCYDCGTNVTMVKNPEVMKKIRDLETECEGLMERYQLTREKIRILTSTLNPIEVVITPKWYRTEQTRECRVITHHDGTTPVTCGRATKYLYGTTPQCYPKCKPRTGKLTLDDMPDITSMLRDWLADDNDDTEYIKKGG